MLLDELNEQQREAAKTIEGNLEIIAGAGTGKTRTITYRIAYMIEKGIPDSSILALTFTNKAANEMKERIKKLVGKNINVTATTFHSFAYKMLRRFRKKTEFKSNFSIADDEMQTKIIKKIFNEFVLNKSWIDEKLAKSLIGKIKDNGCFTNGESEKFLMEKTNFDDNKIKTIVSIFEIYNKELKKNNMMDFADLLLYMHKILQDKEIKEIIQNQYKYFLVDEYQDTNFIQGEIVDLMADKYNNLCVVGDPDQSIYAFRGAEIKIITDFAKKHSKTKIVKLEKNYRSTSEIVEKANNLISYNPDLFEKKLFANKKNGKEIKISSFFNPYDEASYVINQIKENRENEKYNYKDFTILYRNNFQSRIIEQELIRKSIPYRIYGGIGFYDRKEIKDLLSFLKLYSNKNDSFSFERIVQLANSGIGPRGIEKIQEFKRKNNLNYIQVLQYSSQIKGIVKKGKELLEKYYDMFTKAEEKFSDNKKGILKYFFIKSGYEKLLEKGEQEERKENVKELIISFNEKMENGIELDEYLAEISMYNASDEINDKNFVKLMTVHRSKGLEFKYVFIIGVCSDFFPSIKEKDFDKTSYRTLLEEERRLFYVAITRAMECLELTQIKYTSFQKETYPSQFVNELKIKKINEEMNK